jgi:hypothetical protein
MPIQPELSESATALPWQQVWAHLKERWPEAFKDFEPLRLTDYLGREMKGEIERIRPTLLSWNRSSIFRKLSCGET